MGPAGIEPATSPLWVGYSTTELRASSVAYAPHFRGVKEPPQGNRAFSFSLEGEGGTMGAATATPAVNAELARPIIGLRPIPTPFLCLCSRGPSRLY